MFKVMFSLVNLALAYKSHNKQFKQIRNAWQFWFAVSLCLWRNAVAFVSRCSLLNWALCDKAKFLGFSKFNLFGQSLLGFGKSALSAQILESLKP